MPRFPRTRRWLEQLLHTHDTPRRTAAAYGVGVFFGFSPMLGLHTVLGLACAFGLGLNRVAVLLGVYSNLPWILPAYYSLTTLAAAAVIGAEVPPGLLGDMTDAVKHGSWREFMALFRGLRSLLWAYVLGSTIGAILLALVGYQVALTMIQAHRRRAALHPKEHLDS